jgi:hypothetical protein
MPQPAPARFDDHDRKTLWTSVLSAVGPTLSLLVLFAGYSLSAHLCKASNRPWIAAVVALGVAITAGAFYALARLQKADPPLRFLIWMGLALQAYSICVLLAYAVALTTEVRCD